MQNAFTILANYSANIVPGPAIVPNNVYVAGISLLAPANVRIDGFEYDVMDYMDGYIRLYLNFVTIESLAYLDGQYNRMLEAQNTLYNGIVQFNDPTDALAPLRSLIMRNKSDIYTRYRRYKANVKNSNLIGPDQLSTAEAIYRMSQIQ